MLARVLIVVAAVTSAFVVSCVVIGRPLPHQLDFWIVAIVVGTLGVSLAVSLNRVRVLNQKLQQHTLRLTRAISAHASAEATLASTQRIAQVGTFEQAVESSTGVWSYELYHLLGLTPEAVVPRFELLMEFIHSDDRTAMVKALQQVRQLGEANKLVCRIVRADGAVRHVRIVLSADIAANGQPIRVLGICHDITALHGGERLRTMVIDQHLTLKRWEVQRLNLVQYTNSLIDHLTGIVGQLGLTQEQLATRLVGDSKVRHDLAAELAAIDDASRRATEVCQQLTAELTRPDVTQEPINLRDLALQVADDLTDRLPNAPKVVVEWSPEPLMLLGDRHQLVQLLTHLLQNAAEASRTPERKISVRGKRSQSEFPNDRMPKQPHSTFDAEEFIVLEIQDHGCGMPMSVKQQAFQPFYTTKDNAAGMGLPTVKEITRRHGGYVEMDTELDRGTTVRVFLRVDTSEQLLAQSKQRLSTRDDVKGGKLAIVVDDDVTIRQLTQTVLESVGFRVVQAANGREAVELFRSHEADVGLIVTDLEMPELTGVELIEQVRAYRSDMRFILLSGYSQHQDGTSEIENAVHLAKPFRPLDLIQAVHLIREPAQV